MKHQISDEGISKLRDLLEDVKTAPENALMYDWKPSIMRELSAIIHQIKIVEVL